MQNNLDFRFNRSRKSEFLFEVHINRAVITHLITVLFTTFSVCRKIWTGFIHPKREIHSKRPFKRADSACCLHNCCFFSDSNWIWRIIWKWSFWFTPGIPSFDTACATGLPSGSLLSLEKARRFSRWHSGCTQPEPSTSPCVSPTWEKLMTGQETQGLISLLKISQNTCYFLPTKLLGGRVPCIFIPPSNPIRV